ncbi:hypothetical protein MTO96_013693 [Rhipicephalus appendiculatus]
MHTIKAQLRAVRTAAVACRITLLPHVPQAGLKTSLAGTVAELRLASHGETRRERERCKRHSPTGLTGAGSLVVNAAACRRRARRCLCEGMPEYLRSRI